MTKRYLFILFFLQALTLVLFSETFVGKCVGVSDGDTISVMESGRAVKIRLEGIDCPEMGQDFGTRAKLFTSAMVFGKEVGVKEYNLDRYGRMVARVYVEGKDVCLELVKAGLAWHYKHYSSDPVLVAQAEVQARKAKAGLWSMPNPVPPWGVATGAKEAGVSDGCVFVPQIKSQTIIGNSPASRTIAKRERRLAHFGSNREVNELTRYPEPAMISRTPNARGMKPDRMTRLTDSTPITPLTAVTISEFLRALPRVHPNRF